MIAVRRCAVALTVYDLFCLTGCGEIGLEALARSAALVDAINSVAEGNAHKLKQSKRNDEQ